MIRLIFPKRQLSELAADFRAHKIESFALILAKVVVDKGNTKRLLVQSIHVPDVGEYEERTAVSVRPTPAFRLKLEKQAKINGLTLVYCHSHPWQEGVPKFSPVDDAVEKELAGYTMQRVGPGPHVSLLIGAEGFCARELATEIPVEVIEVGQRYLKHYPPMPIEVASNDIYHRQIIAFGEAGQETLRSLCVAIVGLGGTGSVVAQQLLYLGVRKFLLIDPKDLDLTNLNRVVWAKRIDVGKPKVDIAKNAITSLVDDACVDAVKGDVLDEEVGALLTNVDFIFICTDSHGSRHFLNQLSYQYFIPSIDMGVIIVAPQGKVTHMDARVQMLAPGLECLICRDALLSADEVRYDLSTQEQRDADPYFKGRTGIKQPAVISLNSTAVSLAVTMFLAAVVGIPSQARHQTYRGMPGVVKSLARDPNTDCAICGTYFGVGNKYPLPRRRK